MKRIVCLGLALMMLLAAASCGSDKGEQSTTPANGTETADGTGTGNGTDISNGDTAGAVTELLRSENFSVTEPMIVYYENLAYTNMFTQYFSAYYNVYAGDMNAAYEAAASVMSQYTLKDFLASALSMAQELVALAEEAVAQGVSLDEEDHATIQQELETVGKSLGDSVPQKDLQAASELYLLASKYASLLCEDIERGATDEALRAYMKENKDGFYTADMLMFAMTLKAEDYTEDPEGYAVAEQLLDVYSKKLEAAKSPEEFKRLVLEYEVELSTDRLIQQNLGSLAAPSKAMVDAVKATLVDRLCENLINKGAFDTSVSDNATYAALFETVAAKIYAACTLSVSNLSATASYSAQGDNEIVVWLSDESTATGDTRTVSSGNAVSRSVTVYFVERAMGINESITKDVAHILVTAREGSVTEAESLAAKGKAIGILADFRSGEATLESFEALADAYNEDGNCIYRGVSRGQMVEPFDAWIFDESRKVGDTDVVQTVYGYHVMYFVGDGHPAYYESALEGYIAAEYVSLVQGWIEERVTLNEDAIRAAAATTES